MRRLADEIRLQRANGEGKQMTRVLFSFFVHSNAYAICVKIKRVGRPSRCVTNERLSRYAVAEGKRRLTRARDLISLLTSSDVQQVFADETLISLAACRWNSNDKTHRSPGPLSQLEHEQSAGAYLGWRRTHFCCSELLSSLFKTNGIQRAGGSR